MSTELAPPPPAAAPAAAPVVSAAAPAPADARRQLTVAPGRALSPLARRDFGSALPPFPPHALLDAPAPRTRWPALFGMTVFLVFVVGFGGGVGLGVVEAHQDLPGLDLAAVAHQDLADDPALQVLHAAPVALHLDHPGRDRRFGERRHGGPNAEAHHEDQEHRRAEQRRPTGPRRRRVEQDVRREGGQGRAEVAARKGRQGAAGRDRELAPACGVRGGG